MWSIWAQSHGLAQPDKQPREESREQAAEVLVGPVPPPLPSPGFFHPQRHLKCQNLPRRPQIHPPGLSRPRASRGCSQQALRRGAWSGPPSRTAPGRRRVWTTPTRNPGSLPRPEANPGQAGGREGWGQVGTGGGGVAGHGVRGFLPPPAPSLVMLWGWHPWVETFPMLTRLQSLHFQQPGQHPAGWAERLQPVAAGARLLLRGPHPQCSWAAAGPYQCPGHPRHAGQEGPSAAPEVRARPPQPSWEPGGRRLPGLWDTRGRHGACAVASP